MYKIDKNCILCLQKISGKTKPEHILLNALGGRATVRDIVCSNCNTTMGHGADQDLADSVALIRNIGNLISGDGGTPPTIHRVTNGDMTFDITPGMQVKPIQAGKKIKISEDDRGIEISISATNRQEARNLMKKAALAIAKRLGRLEPEAVEAIHADLLRGHDMQDTIVPGPPVSGHFPFGAGRSQQSMAKAAFILWARLIGVKEAAQPRYDPIRSFILRSDAPTDTWPHSKLDCRSLPKTPSQYGTSPNIIQVSSNDNGAVFGYFGLYGAIGWRFLLCSSGAPPNRASSLISNPFQNEIFKIAKDENAILPPAWMLADADVEDQDLSQIAARLKPLMMYAQAVSKRMMIRKWVEEACIECGLTEGDQITEQHIKYISYYTGQRALVSSRK